TTRSSSRRRTERPEDSTMKRILIVGGGVGGTLVANLVQRKLHREIDAGEVATTLIDERGEHPYQPGFMYIALGSERPEKLVRPESSLLEHRVELIVGRVDRIDERRRLVELQAGLQVRYYYLVLASGSRIVPESIPHFAVEAHHFYSPQAALRLRHALDAF